MERGEGELMEMTITGVGEGVASLRVRFCHPTILEEASLDVLAGLIYLEGEGIDTVVLIGHSLGDAVVIQVATLDEQVRTVVTLATQSYGTAPVSQLAPRCSILLIHREDRFPEVTLRPGGHVGRTKQQVCSRYLASLELDRDVAVPFSSIFTRFQSAELGVVAGQGTAESSSGLLHPTLEHLPHVLADGYGSGLAEEGPGLVAGEGLCEVVGSAPFVLGVG